MTRVGCARHPGRRDVGRGAAVHKGGSGGLWDANTVRPVTEVGGQILFSTCLLKQVKGAERHLGFVGSHKEIVLVHPLQ